MTTINRSLVTVRVREPFVKWLESLPDPLDLTIEEINEDCTAYLLPEYAYEDDTEELLEVYYDMIFDDQLTSWWEDPKDWPEERTLEVFDEWFDVEFHSMVIDCVDEPLERQE